MSDDDDKRCEQCKRHALVGAIPDDEIGDGVRLAGEPPNQMYLCEDCYARMYPLVSRPLNPDDTVN